MRLLDHRGQTGIVDIGGVRRKIMLTLTPEAQIGDYLIVHAGVALEILDREEAERAMDLLRQLEETDA
jgi:hydrogenase expression/formation protein HypC